MTTENTEVGITTDIITLDDITTDIPRTYNDITKGITTSYRDVTTTPFPTTTLDVETASQEIPSTQNLDEVSGKTEGVGLDNGVTTPSTEGPHRVEQLEREILDRGKQVNYAAKSTDGEFSNQLRSLIRNTSYVDLKEDVEISAQNGIHVERIMESSGTDGDEMEIISTTELPVLSSSVSRSSSGTDSASLTKDMIMTRTETSEMIIPTHALSTENHLSTSSDEYSTLSPDSSISHRPTTFRPELQRTENTKSNSTVGATITATKRPIETLLEAATSRTTVQQDTPTNRVNDVSTQGVSTEATSAKYLSNLNSTTNPSQTKNEGVKVQSITGASGDLTNVPVSRKQLGFISKDLCGRTFTAVAALGPTLFLFQGQHLWRVNVSSGQTLSSEKETVQSYFGLDGQKVTAAFYREAVDEWTIFTYIDVFIIRNHSQSQKTSDFHRMRVTELGIPFGVVVDAAFHDDSRKKSYLFTNRWVWRYDDERGDLDIGYPRRSHHEFRGLMQHRPSAAVTLNGKHFILYGKKYMEIDRDTHQIDERRGEHFFEDHFDCLIDN
eukprot:XP_011663320.1 PREDICTED: mucin-4 [Strongylocentrotus purpuratus]